MKLKKSEQILLAVTAVVGLVFLFQQYGGALTGTSSGSSPSEVKQQVETEVRKLSKAKNELRKLTKKLNVGKFTLPPTSDSPDVYLHIRKTAEKCELSFSEFPSTPPQKGKGFQTIGYQFKATAKLGNLIRFVDEIQSGGYLISLENWSMKPAGEGEQVEANLSVVAYFQPARRKR